MDNCHLAILMTFSHCYCRVLSAKGRPIAAGDSGQEYEISCRLMLLILETVEDLFLTWKEKLGINAAILPYAQEYWICHSYKYG